MPMTALPAKNFLTRTDEYDTRRFFVQLDAEVDYATVINDPMFWRHHAQKMHMGELIRVRAVDGTWDVQLVVDAVLQGGLKVSEWPKWPPQVEAREEAPAPATIVDPPKAKDADPLPRVEFTKATGWRVVGYDSNEVSRDHKTKADAEKAMKNYTAALNRAPAV